MVGMCVGYVLCDRIAEGNMLFRSVTTNTFLIGACLLAETAFFIFMFVSILVLGLHSTMAINVISLGAGAVVTTYILGLLGCVVGVVSVTNSENWTDSEGLFGVAAAFVHVQGALLRALFS